MKWVWKLSLFLSLSRAALLILSVRKRDWKIRKARVATTPTTRSSLKRCSSWKFTKRVRVHLHKDARDPSGQVWTSPHSLAVSNHLSSREFDSGQLVQAGVYTRLLPPTREEIAFFSPCFLEKYLEYISKDVVSRVSFVFWWVDGSLFSLCSLLFFSRFDRIVWDLDLESCARNLKDYLEFRVS